MAFATTSLAGVLEGKVRTNSALLWTGLLERGLGAVEVLLAVLAVFA